MKKEILCESCLHVISEETICDTCGKEISIYGQLIYEIGKIPIINLVIDNTNYDFCDYECTIKFLTKEKEKI
jgi:hypothetical protein